jgi:hypothetical protein
MVRQSIEDGATANGLILESSRKIQSSVEVDSSQIPLGKLLH